MTPEAERILDMFKTRRIRAGGYIHPADFGDVIIWEDGSIRDEPVRNALFELFSNGYLLELHAGFELTERGANYLNGVGESKHGARVYQVGDRMLIKQTVLRGTPAVYVIDEHRERHVRQDNDAAIASAIRDAIAGNL